MKSAAFLLCAVAVAHADAPSPYSLGFALRPVAPGSVIRSDTAVGMFSDDGTSGTTVASTFALSYKLDASIAPLVRFAVVRGDDTTALSNPLVGAIWAPPLLAPPFKLGVFGGLALPLGSGGGNQPDADALATVKAAMPARSSMDNALFAVNDLTPIAGVDVAYVAYGLTLQAEATVFELVRVRGDEVQADAYKTNLTSGLHAGYFIVPWLSACGELRYQRWLSTPKAVAADATGASRDTWSAAAGVRGHIALGNGRWLRPGVSYARGLDDPMAGRSYQIVQIDVPFAF